MPAPDAVIGRHLDQLSLEQRRALAGQWVAYEVYSIERTPLRRIEALGPSVSDCISVLKRRGLDPYLYEFTPLRPPY